MKSYIVFGTLIISVAHAQQPAWGQCGGTGWTGQTSCATGYYCAYSNPWYSQCVPESGTSTVPETTASTTGTSTVPETTSSTTGTSTVPETTSSTTGTLTTATTPPTSKGDAKTKFVGVNIAGFDFGCATDGACNLSKTYPPLSSLGGSNGLGQMQHFAQEDNMNVFRLPVGWQYLQDSLGAPLNPTNLGFYDQLVQECLSTGAICIVDIHNYARWNGQIIGQGGPTNDQFANLWSQVAAKYANNTKVVFGLMNEPHDSLADLIIVDINEWAVSLQTAVNAIRGAGAASNFLLLAGSNYSSAAIFTTESAAALSKIKDSDGKTSKLIFDVHQYLDIDGSGTNATCTTNNTESFNQLASWLRTHDRKAFLTETGGGNTTSCMNYLCQQVAAINAASDVFVGIVGWAAGGFDDSFPLNETPTNSSGVLIDQPLLTACLAR